MTNHRPVIVVSGLPRSGTSMAMQMLQAGGISILTDSLRAADEDNPRGYFEFERVKQLKTDQAWLDDAAGKAVKIIHLLLMELPADRPFKVLLMRRDLHEVVRSQSVMLERSGRSGAAMTPERLMGVFQAQLDAVKAWLAQRPNFDVIELDHSEFISNPLRQAHAINQFLGGGLDEAAMAKAVDPGLHRNKKS